MAVYLRAAAFGLSTNYAIKDLMGAIPHSRCYGKVIPTRSLPEYTIKYTKSSEAMMSDVNSSRNDLPSRCDVVASDKQSNKETFGLELPDSLQKNMIHSSSVYAKIKELAPIGSCVTHSCQIRYQSTRSIILQTLLISSAVQRRKMATVTPMYLKFQQIHFHCIK